MKIKIGINGMGRIGRMIIRSIIENNNQNIEIKHINKLKYNQNNNENFYESTIKINSKYKF